MKLVIVGNVPKNEPETEIRLTLLPPDFGAMGETKIHSGVMLAAVDDKGQVYNHGRLIEVYPEGNTLVIKKTYKAGILGVAVRYEGF